MIKNDNQKQSEAPLIEHLTELRSRIIKAVLFIICAVGFCFFYAQEIFIWLLDPIKSALGDELTVSYFAPHEAFFVYMNLALYSGLIVSIPIIIMQLWRFVVPGLYQSEKQAIRPFLWVTPIMFLIGVSTAYFVVLPTALSFFASFQTVPGEGSVQIIQQVRAQDYAHFALTFLMVFGLAFELPVLLILFGIFGVVRASDLVTFRKYAVLLIAIISAFLTPPDLFSMAGLGIPLYLLYEISIIIIKLYERKNVEKN